MLFDEKKYEWDDTVLTELSFIKRIKLLINWLPIDDKTLVCAYGQWQAIIWTDADVLWNGPLRTSFQW